MKYLLSSLLLSLAVVVGLLLLSVTPSQAGDDGATSFNNFCSTCHGDTGAGDGPAAAGLDPKPANFQDPKFWEGKTDDYLKKVIKEGGPAVGKSSAMAPWGNVLSDAQVDAVIAEHTDAADKVRAGDSKPIQFLMGMVMRASKGKANPQMVQQLLRDKLQG